MPYRLSLFLALLLGACSAPEPPAAPPPAQAEAPQPGQPARPASQDFAQGQAEFGVDLYRQLAAGKGNLFISPASISTALAMVHAGAEGETAAEMARALRYPANVHEEAGRLLKALPLEAEGRRLSVANALWVQRSFPLKPAYLELVRRHYGGSAQPVDFVGAPAQAIAEINRWAEEQTAGRIRNLLRPDNISERTRLILTNAVYFKGDWLRPFRANATRPRPFHIDATRSVTVPFMRQRAQFRFLEEPGFKAVELPYKGEELSMMLFLPEPKGGLAEFERRLTPERLMEWIEALRKSGTRDMELVMPKLELQTRASLVPPLQALGMRRAFTDRAELRGIADAQLRISDVIHQTYLRVDEKGTEAAALTAPIVEIVSMPWPFHLDRPYFFLIRDNRSGTMLFMGRIQDPSAAA